jgi:hypothetical protein
MFDATVRQRVESKSLKEMIEILPRGVQTIAFPKIATRIRSSFDSFE